MTRISALSLLLVFAACGREEYTAPVCQVSADCPSEWPDCVPGLGMCAVMTRAVAGNELNETRQMSVTGITRMPKDMVLFSGAFHGESESCLAVAAAVRIDVGLEQATFFSGKCSSNGAYWGDVRIPVELLKGSPTNTIMVEFRVVSNEGTSYMTIMFIHELFE